MLKHFLNLYDVLPNLYMPEIDDLLPYAVSYKSIETLCKQPVYINSIRKRLQDLCKTVLDAGMQFWRHR